MKRFERWMKRIRGALGIGALGAIAFNVVGWLIIGGEALAAGAWPSLTTIARMCMFTIPVGGFAGILTAGAIAAGAGSSRLITGRRAFLLGLPLGAAGGLLISLSVASLPVSALLVNAVAFGLGTGVLGAGAVTIAERGSTDRLFRKTRTLAGGRNSRPGRTSAVTACPPAAARRVAHRPTPPDARG